MERPEQPSDISILEFNASIPQSNHATSTSTILPLQQTAILDSTKERAVDSEENEDKRFLEGLKLYLVVAGLMLVGFLVALNGSFVATVRFAFRSPPFHMQSFDLICFLEFLSALLNMHGS
jgi:hypothetical protein